MVLIWVEDEDVLDAEAVVVDDDDDDTLEPEVVVMVVVRLGMERWHSSQQTPHFLT